MRLPRLGFDINCADYDWSEPCQITKLALTQQRADRKQNSKLAATQSEQPLEITNSKSTVITADSATAGITRPKRRATSLRLRRRQPRNSDANSPKQADRFERAKNAFSKQTNG